MTDKHLEALLKAIVLTLMLGVAAVTCGCITVEGFSLFNGVVSVDRIHMPTPSLYKFGSVQKANGAGVDIIHFEREGLEGTGTVLAEPEVPE